MKSLIYIICRFQFVKEIYRKFTGFDTACKYYVNDDLHCLFRQRLFEEHVHVKNL